MQKMKAMMELKDQVFSSLPQKLAIRGRLYCVLNASSLYSSFDYPCRYPSEILFFTDQLALPTTRGTQVCQAEGFRLFRQALGRSGKMSPRTKEQLS